MSKISINLLPPEIQMQELKKTRFYLIQTIGVAVILVLAFLASLTAALRILQNNNIATYKVKLARAEQKVSDLKSGQASLFVLKNRLSVIDQYLGMSSKQVLTYKLIDKLIPSSISVSAISIDNAGTVTLAVLVRGSVDLDLLINNLSSKNSNEDKIAQVSIESLTRGRDNFYRVGLKVKPN